MTKKLIWVILGVTLFSIATLVLYENRIAANVLRYQLMGWDPCLATSFEYNNYNIRDLKYDELPYVSTKIAKYQDYPVDDAGIPVQQQLGKNTYHPVMLAQHCLRLLYDYHETNDTNQLLLTIVIMNKLNELALKVDSAILFPYTFDHIIHSRRYMVSMTAPWYSAMAQGQLLSVLTRLYVITNDNVYLERAEKVYNSFNRLKATHDPWISCIDKNNNIWLEEYPCEMPCFTLNGMIFAIYGIYDFYRITKRDDVKAMLLGAITTIEINIVDFRNPNEISYYCLKHQIKSLGYHVIHGRQLNKLFLITGENHFKEMAVKFTGDTVQ